MASQCRRCGAELDGKATACRHCESLPTEQQEAIDAIPPTGQANVTWEAVEGADSDDISDSELDADLDAVEEFFEPERLLWSGAYSYRALLPAWLLASLFTVVVGIVSLFLVSYWNALFIALLCAVISLGGVGLYLAYRRLVGHYELTCDWFVHKTGLLTGRRIQIDVLDIDDIAVGQTPFERRVGVGTIKVVSLARSDPELLMPGISNVREAATEIDRARRAARRRRGVVFEAD